MNKLSSLPQKTKTRTQSSCSQSALQKLPLIRASLALQLGLLGEHKWVPIKPVLQSSEGVHGGSTRLPSLPTQPPAGEALGKEICSHPWTCTPNTSASASHERVLCAPQGSGIRCIIPAEALRGSSLLKAPRAGQPGVPCQWNWEKPRPKRRNNPPGDPQRLSRHLCKCCHSGASAMEAEESRKRGRG